MSVMLVETTDMVLLTLSRVTKLSIGLREYVTRPQSIDDITELS